MTDPRLHLAAELRVAGLTEKADALLAEVLQEQTGTRPFNEIKSDLDNTFASLRSTLGMRPKRRRAKNPKPTVQERLTALLQEAGVSGLSVWSFEGLLAPRPSRRDALGVSRMELGRTSRA